MSDGLAALAIRYKRLEELIAMPPKTADERAELLEYFLDRDDNVRILASRAAAALPEDVDCVEALLGLAENRMAPDAVRYEAYRGLGGHVREGDLWSKLGAEERDAETEAALRIFPMVLSSLRSVLEDAAATPTLRAGVVEALGPLAGEDWVAPAVGGLWYSGDARGRVAALGAVARSGHRRWRGIVAEALEEGAARGDELIFRRALLAAGALGLEEHAGCLAAQALERRLRPAVRRAALGGLAALGTREARRALRRVAEDARDPLRYEARGRLDELAWCEQALGAGEPGNTGSEAGV